MTGWRPAGVDGLGPVGAWQGKAATASCPTVEISDRVGHPQRVACACAVAVLHIRRFQTWRKNPRPNSKSGVPRRRSGPENLARARELLAKPAHQTKADEADAADPGDLPDLARHCCRRPVSGHGTALLERGIR